MNEAAPSEGGFLVDTPHAASIWEKANSVGQILSRCTKQPVTTKSNKLQIPAVSETSRANGSRYGGLALAYLDEAGQFPTSNIKFQMLGFHTKLLGGAVVITNEAFSDAAGFEAWFNRMAGTEIAFVLEDMAINGSGSGRPLGILAADCTITCTPDSGQSAATLRATNCSQLASRLWSGSYSSPGTCWLTNTDGFRQLVDQTQANGAPLVDFDADGPVRHSIFGWPLLTTEYTAELGQRGDLILGDFNQYLVSERESGVIGSVHLRWLSDENTLLIKSRADAMPSFSSPITPKSGSATQSPFVTLGAR